MTEATEVISAEQAAAAAETLKRAIVAKFDNKVDAKEASFHFKSVKVKDAEGKETGDTIKRPTVSLTLPVPSVEGIIAIIEGGGKGLELLLEAAADIVLANARELINDDESLTQANFPLEKLAWEYIANLPKAERRGGGISKETWEEFSKDYIAVMPAVTGKTTDQVTAASKILLSKFNGQVKTNKPVLKLLQSQLALYVSNSPRAEEFAECAAFLEAKAEALLNLDEAALLANL